MLSKLGKVRKKYLEVNDIEPKRAATSEAPVDLRIQTALFGKRKWIEALVAVESIGPLSLLQPIDNEVCQGSCEDFIGDFENIGSNDHVGQRSHAESTDEG